MTKLIVGPSRLGGRGVFAASDIAAGEIVEQSPVLLSRCRCEEDEHSYEWGEDGSFVIVLGYGSLYNHAKVPNVSYSRDLEALAMTYTALRNIREGDELLIDYGWGDTPLWFEVNE